MHRSFSNFPISSYFPYSNFHQAILYLYFLLQHLAYSSMPHMLAFHALKTKATRFSFIYYQQHVLSFNSVASLLRNITYISLFSCTCHCQNESQTYFLHFFSYLLRTKYHSDKIREDEIEDSWNKNREDEK